jgi:hypothetical protein
MIPPFRDPVAERLWQRYFADVDQLVARAGEEAAGLADDLRAHLAESYAAGQPERSEVDRLQAAIDRLGRPADYLHPLLADELLERGSRTYHPAPIARGLYHAVRSGSYRALVGALFALGYGLLASFTAMALLKPLWADHVGLFRNPNGTVSFGIVAETAGSRELLGLWIMPIAAVVALVLYVMLTRSLRAVRWR